MNTKNINKKELSSEQREELLSSLQARFEANMSRHADLTWADVQARLEANSEKLWSLYQMESTGGEPDVVGRDQATGELIFYDCAEQSPAGRRSLCYDQAALEARKAIKPKDSAINMAATMGIALLTEVEYRYLQTLGEFDTKTSSWVISQPDTGEQALEITETLVRSGAVDVVVVDSVAALVPRSEIEGDMGDPTMGTQARLMSQAMRKLSGAINQTRTAVIFTNQLRHKIGVMFGNPETTTGGNALKFYASIRLDVRRIQSIKVGSEIVGNRVRVRVVKNKIAAPFRTAEFDIMYNEGISKVGDILDLGTEMDIIEKHGSWYSYGDIRLGQGRENAKEYLQQDEELAAVIEKAVREQSMADGAPSLWADDDSDYEDDNAVMEDEA